MNVYIWQRIKNASNNYHTEGGVVVIAGDEAAARKAANAVPGCTIQAEEKPSAVFVGCGCGLIETEDGQNVFIFPDAGCC